MRRLSTLPGIRRAAVLALGIALAMSFAPATAFAAVPHSTLMISTVYMVKAKPFYVSGRISTSVQGKKIAIEVRKPGRTFWTTVGSATISSTGRFSYKYTPKLGGKFFVRTRYGGVTAGLSRTATLVVKEGPGVKYQIVLASTTSTRDSGLFERIGPAFLAACPEYSMKATFVGSGAAIALGGTGDADVLLTHSPAAEVDFMNGIVAGNPSTYKGRARYKVMYNDYVVVGPTANPAGVVMSDTAKDAFSDIASAGSPFWSRNDNSGTNAMEKSIWASLGNPQTGQSWYKASGTMGMAQALAAANDASTGGYTLADRATWLNAGALGTTKNLKIVNAGDPALFNQYSVIEVAGARNAEGAMDFSRWIRTPEAQALIATYGEYTYGQSLFTPNGGKY